MKNIKNILVSAVIMMSLASPLALAPVQVSAAAIDDACKNGGGTSAICDKDSSMSLQSIIHTIINILLFVIGAISVIMIIIGGIRYTVSGGESGAITGAKNTILYAIIGLIVAFLAFAIVQWVFGAISNTP